MCLYLYMHNKYTQYTFIYYANKNFILDAINNWQHSFFEIQIENSYFKL